MAFTLRLPLKVASNGALDTHTQGSTIEVAQSVQTLLATVQGERSIESDYGLPSQIGMYRIDDQEIRVAVTKWEPRADRLEVAVDDTGSNAVVTFTVDGAPVDLSLNILGGGDSVDVSGPVIELPDGTLISSSAYTVDDGDGTYSPIGSWPVDGGDGTYSVGG